MKTSYLMAMAAGAVICISQPAFAQEVDLMSMEIGSLRPEVQRRYDDALAATTNPSVLASLGSSYTYASEAKVWCGIATGFLKTSTRDKESLSRCEKYHRLMTQAPATQVVAMPEPPAPRPRTAACDTPLAATFFFDWDSVALPANTDETIRFVSENMVPCGWTSFTVVGHTDRSGSDGYNEPLSRRRADAVAAKMREVGVAGSALAISGRGESEPKVSTADGERNPTNRRVEVTANN